VPAMVSHRADRCVRLVEYEYPERGAGSPQRPRVLVLLADYEPSGQAVPGVP
jgi:hypothetical protein